MMKFVLLMLLLVTPANAIVYFGNPDNDILCGYMDPDGPQTHWDGNDPPQYQAPTQYLEGSSQAEWSLISVSCNKSWASVSFGADEVPGANWGRKVYGHSSGPGYEDDATCTIYHGAGNLWVTYQLHLRN